MPKVNLGPKEDKRESQVRFVISGWMEMQHVHSRKALADKVHISSSTLCNHFNHPEDMKLGELWAILDYLKVPAEERAKIL